MNPFQPWIDAMTIRPPDFVIGWESNPYMRRWHITPLNPGGGGIYLHQILRDDDDRALHDHPFDNTSIILSGSYYEIMPDGQARMRMEGDVIHRVATDRHRICVADGPVWSLFLVGPRYREWGFWCPKGFVPWYDFVDPTDRGRIGPGCGG